MNAPAPTSSLMSGDDFRESLRRYKPHVFLDGRQVDSVVDERGFGPGINAIANLRLRTESPVRAHHDGRAEHTSGKRVNRLTHINTSSGDLFNKLETVRLVCQISGLSALARRRLRKLEQPCSHQGFGQKTHQRQQKTGHTGQKADRGNSGNGKFTGFTKEQQNNG